MNEDEMQWSLEQENAEVLAELKKDGIDLSGARPIEFLLALPDEAAATAAVQALGARGYAAEVRPPEPEAIEDGDEEWAVAVTRELEPTAPEITRVEEEVAAIAAEHGGESDGWTFSRGA